MEDPDFLHCGSGPERPSGCQGTDEEMGGGAPRRRVAWSGSAVPGLRRGGMGALDMDSDAVATPQPRSTDDRPGRIGGPRRLTKTSRENEPNWES